MKTSRVKLRNELRNLAIHNGACIGAQRAQTEPEAVVVRRSGVVEQMTPTQSQLTDVLKESCAAQLENLKLLILLPLT